MSSRIRANRQRDVAYLDATIVAHTLQQGEAPGAITTSWAVAKRLWPEAVARLGQRKRQQQMLGHYWPLLSSVVSDTASLGPLGPVIWVYQQARPGTLTFWFPHSGTVVHDNFYTGLRASVESPL